MPVTNFVIGSRNKVMGRKRLESFGSGTIAPSFRMDGDNPEKNITGQFQCSCFDVI
jgi:hypothetical protein